MDRMSHLLKCVRSCHPLGTEYNYISCRLDLSGVLPFYHPPVTAAYRGYKIDLQGMIHIQDNELLHSVPAEGACLWPRGRDDTGALALNVFNMEL